jgi:hypothetical protein
MILFHNCLIIITLLIKCNQINPFGNERIKCKINMQGRVIELNFLGIQFECNFVGWISRRLSHTRIYLIHHLYPVPCIIGFKCDVAAVHAAVCGSPAVCGRAAVCSSVTDCGSARGSSVRQCGIVCGSASGSVWQCMQQCAAVRQCLIVRAAVCGSAQQFSGT